ncbi:MULTISPECIES: sulfotransferase family 2 domain-containing protein [unclassified Oceanobacter]|uniref:sulfotransferase family 2 domain-containing protein n=1 Tax=unclassified Oceanobacter TaxID=2620260 RepID=UPI0026E36974|nr:MULTISPECIES: sulfotransferase family 2 domain-containing protein [unclassified Oceanobacter]MDO6681332.1 sulfotransferase family 2 domain-containing protein [Oceanobacter sp. 5_MG-2023]MDP2505043.1 sulfotransferase family 2 domain-containing protein [Oceanobacter sp. 3_MG-2023]
MFVSDNIIFLELHKTACTHIREILMDVVGGSFIGKHNKVPRAMIEENVSFIGSVRNPLDWYVSLWSYGCDGKGSVYTNSTNGNRSVMGLGWKQDAKVAFKEVWHLRNKNQNAWERVYSDRNNKKNFREWIRMINAPEFYYDFGEGYGVSGAAEHIGLLTFRYLDLFCTAKNERVPPFLNLAEVADFEQKKCLIRNFVRNESLEKDLLQALDDLNVVIKEEQREKIIQRPKSNTSKRSANYIDYYDKDTIDLVRDRESLIFDKFGY